MSVKNRKRERAWNPRETMRNQRKQAGGEEQVNCPFVCSLTPARLPPLCSVVQGPPGRGLGPGCWVLLSANSLSAIPALAVASPFSTSLTSSERNPGVSCRQAFPSAQTKKHISALALRAPVPEPAHMSVSPRALTSPGQDVISHQHLHPWPRPTSNMRARQRLLD